MNSVFEQKATNISDSVLKLTYLCRGGKVGWLDMPSQDSYIRLDIGKLLFHVDSFISKVSNIDAIVLFGSSVRVKIIEETYGWIFQNKKKKIVQSEGKIPSDIDVLIILKKDSELLSSRVKTSLDFSQRIDTDYESFIDYRTIKDGLDIFAMTQEQFDEELSKRVTVAENIIKDGVLVAGNFPHVLHNPLKIKWNDYSPYFDTSRI